MRSFKLVLAYDGAAYLGWQIQAQGRTIQAELEHALRAVTGETIRVTASGRTDAGVHALGQVVSFESATDLESETLRRALNGNLPKDIRIATAWFKPKYNLTDITPDYFIHETDQWLVFPHELEGLTREEMFANKPGMKKLFEEAELD